MPPTSPTVEGRLRSPCRRCVPPVGEHRGVFPPTSPTVEGQLRSPCVRIGGVPPPNVIRGAPPHGIVAPVASVPRPPECPNPSVGETRGPVMIDGVATSNTPTATTVSSSSVPDGGVIPSRSCRIAERGRSSPPIWVGAVALAFPAPSGLSARRVVWEGLVVGPGVVGAAASSAAERRPLGRHGRTSTANGIVLVCGVGRPVAERPRNVGGRRRPSWWPCGEGCRRAVGVELPTGPRSIESSSLCSVSVQTIAS